MNQRIRRRRVRDLGRLRMSGHWAVEKTEYWCVPAIFFSIVL